MNIFKKGMTSLLAVAFGGMLSFGAANAAPVVYFGEDLNPGGTVPAGGNAETARNSFQSALTAGVQTEDFESFTTGSGSPLNLSFTGSGGSTINAQLSGAGGITSCCGRFPTSGRKHWEVSSGNFTVDFGASPVAAFGFYATDIGDFNGQVTLALHHAGGGITNLVINNTVNAPNGALLFYGLIDVLNPFTKVVFGNTNPGVDYFGFDDMTVGDVKQVKRVPAPAALSLMGLGLLGFAAVARRRRNA